MFETLIKNIEQNNNIIYIIYIQLCNDYNQS